MTWLVVGQIYGIIIGHVHFLGWLDKIVYDLSTSGCENLEKSLRWSALVSSPTPVLWSIPVVDGLIMVGRMMRDSGFCF